MAAQFPRNVRLISSANRDFLVHRDFLILSLMNTSAYLFTEKFLFNNIYDNFINNGHIETAEQRTTIQRFGN